MAASFTDLRPLAILCRLALLTLTMYFVSHCGPPTPAISGSEALVTHEQATQAFAIIEGIDYLPFAYIVDGCYDRAFYMAMELAAAKIPSSVQYAVAHSGSLHPRSDIYWLYHVAPMLWVENAQQPTMIDPSVNASPMPRSDWVEQLKPEYGVDLYWAEGSQWNYRLSPDRSGPSNADRLIRTFAELDPFAERDILSACGEMKGFLASEPGTTAEERDRKIEKLQSRTSQLHAALYQLGKVTGTAAPGSMTCR